MSLYCFSLQENAIFQSALKRLYFSAVGCLSGQKVFETEQNQGWRERCKNNDPLLLDICREVTKYSKLTDPKLVPSAFLHQALKV